MKSNATKQLEALLEARKKNDLFRSLKNNSHLIDFCSNDYLGFSTLGILQKEIYHFRQQSSFANEFYGATGSRLISGNSIHHELLEFELANLYKREAALLFNSGYDANLGLFSSIAQKNDLVLFDELCHASIHDGLKMCRSKSIAFKHNDLDDLEKHLKESVKKYMQIYVATESIFSMDGDFAPLKALVKLRRKYGFEILVDEAHATGVFGPKGAGRVVELNLDKDIFASVHTFGKALGAHGAVVLGSSVLKDFLINFARSFIFTTALPLESILAIKCAHDILTRIGYNTHEISGLVKLFKTKITKGSSLKLIPSNSQIQSVLIPGNKEAKAAATCLEENGIYAKAILYPTVPKGKERIRICLHTFNSESEIDLLCRTLKSI